MEWGRELRLATSCVHLVNQWEIPDVLTLLGNPASHAQSEWCTWSTYIRVHFSCSWLVQCPPSNSFLYKP